MNKFSNNFKIVYWLVLVVFLTIYIVVRSGDLLSGNSNGLDILIFILWFSLIIFPLVKEINILGVSIKKEIEEIRKEIVSTVNSLRIDLKTHNQFQPTINFNAKSASTEEIEQKIKTESEEGVGKKTRQFSLSKNKENKQFSKNEDVLNRLEKIKGVEQLVFNKLFTKYKDNINQNIKFESNLGKKIIADGVLYSGSSIKEIIEIKFVSYKSMNALKYIVGRYLKKMMQLGLSIPIRFIVVSEEITSIDARNIKNDTALLNVLSGSFPEHKMPKVRFEFYKLTNNNLEKVEIAKRIKNDKN